MHPVLQKTLGGLSKAYYFRQLFFGLALAAFLLFALTQGGTDESGASFSAVIYLVLCALLYPYSRFVYESVVGFIMGSNIFVLPLPIMLFAKLITMVMCFGFAIFVAPVGMAYLYWHHSKTSA